MLGDEDPTQENRPEPRLPQTAVSHVQARDIQIGQIVQKIVYWGIPSNSPLRAFALVISIALYLTLLISGFVLLWRDGSGAVPLLLLCVGSGLLSLTCLYYARFWRPEIQDKNLPISADSPADELVKKHQIKERSRRQTRRLTMIGFIAIPVLTFCGFLVWRSLPPPSVLLLVANFDGVEQQTYRVTENILRNLRKATEPYPDVKVQALNKSITEQQGSDVARAVGAQKKASIVIWGEYGVTDDHVQLSTYFEVLKPPTYFPELEQGEAQTSAIVELNSFKLQTRLSDEMSYLTLFTLGMVQYAKEDWTGAIERFSTALDQVKEPVTSLDQAAVYFYRGICYHYNHDYEKAITDYTQALKLNPDDAEAYTNRGVVYADQGKYSEAIADYTQALKLNPDLAEAYNNRGLVHGVQGKYREAIADYTQALKLNPDFAWAYYNQACAYSLSRDVTAAIENLQQAIRLDIKLRVQAKPDSNFDNIRQNQQFQALVGE
jgi:Tfp pilus assembly protein PilF